MSAANAMRKKVLLGCPTYEGKRAVVQRWLAAVKQLKGNFDVLLADNSKSDAFFNELKRLGIPVIKTPWFPGARDRIITARNALRDIVLQKGYDWFLSIEQDVLPNANDLQQLLSHNKPIVSGLVHNNYIIDGKTMRLPMVWFPAENDPEGLMQARDEQLKGNALINVRGVSLSCVLIHRNILEKIKFRYSGNAFDDMMFCKDAQEKGFEIVVDPLVRPEHVGGDWQGMKI